MKRFPAAFRFFSIMCIATGMIVTLNTFYGVFHWVTITSYFVIGISMTAFGWGADELWNTSFSRMIPGQHSITAFLIRMAFWYMAGGIAYVTAIVFAKKFALLGVADIPVKEIFDTGAKLGCIMQLLLQTVFAGFVEPKATKTNEMSHDIT